MLLDAREIAYHCHRYRLAVRDLMVAKESCKSLLRAPMHPKIALNPLLRHQNRYTLITSIPRQYVEQRDHLLPGTSQQSFLNPLFRKEPEQPPSVRNPRKLASRDRDRLCPSSN